MNVIIMQRKDTTSTQRKSMNVILVQRNGSITMQGKKNKHKNNVKEGHNKNVKEKYKCKNTITMQGKNTNIKAQ